VAHERHARELPLQIEPSQYHPAARRLERSSLLERGEAGGRTLEQHAAIDILG
jgi:hypothetical protein